MLFKIDENLPSETASMPRDAGHDAATVVEQGMTGSADATIASVCRRERRALVTLDTDFGDIRAYPPAEYFGLIVLRLERQDKSQVLSVLERVVTLLTVEPLQARLWIVEADRVRIRD